MSTNEKYYKIDVKKSLNLVEMSIVGTWQHKIVEDFVRDYSNMVSSIDVTNFDLKIDCTDMNVITQDMIPALENSYKMYKSSGFKKVIFLIKKSPVIKMQLNRVARNTGLSNSEFVEV